MSDELEPKPVVGEDGELLEDDQSVDMQVYYTYVDSFFPHQTPGQQLWQFASNNPVVVIAVLLVSVTIFSWSSIPSSFTTQTATRPASTAAPRTSVPASPTAAPTKLAADEKLAPHLPAAGQSLAFSYLKKITKIRWSPNGKYIALQSGSNLVAIWDVDKNGFLYYASQPQSNFSWSSTSRYLYLILHKMIDAHQSPVFTRISLSHLNLQADSRNLKQPWILAGGLPKLLVTSSQNQTALLSANGLALSIIDPRQPTWLVIRQLDEPAHDLDWTPDGRWLSAVKESGIWKWLPNSDAFLVLAGHYQQASWSLDGTEIAVTQDLMGADVHFFVLSVINPYRKQVKWSQRLTQSSALASNANAQVTWSPDGKQIATFIEGDTSIELWDAKTGKNTAHFSGTSAINSIDWSPDSGYLAIGSDSGAQIWLPS